MISSNNQKLKIVREIVRPPFRMWKGNDGIVRATTEDNVWLNINDAHEFLAMLEEITGGIPHRVLFIPGRHMSADKESRTYMASDAGMKYTSALAVVVRSVAHRIIGNLFIVIDRPKRPVQNFNSESDAIDWLKKHMS